LFFNPASPKKYDYYVENWSDAIIETLDKVANIENNKGKKHV